MKCQLLFIALFTQTFSFATGWQSISNFGSNPGNLNAYEYVPANMPANAPLVVVMHGCSQNASNFSNETGWNTLADFHKFYVVHAEQKSANNSTTCFNYWEPGDHSRGQGEAESIKQMVDYMKSTHSIDASRVFATGLSAGGAMTAVMLSAYPDVFAAGAEMAGLPYKVATNYAGVYTAAVGLTDKSPQEWGNLVRAQNPNYTGSYPRLIIIHGTSDIVINSQNAGEMMEQFTNLHNTDQNADYTNPAFNGNSVVELKQYHNANGDVVVERYTIQNMGHGIAVDPGNCFEQGGGTGSNALDVGFYSSFYAAKFFGILRPPFAITGSELVTDSAETNYAVTSNAGSNYNWQVTGGNVASGQNTNSITVDWVDTTGVVSLTETTSGGCVLGPVELAVVINIPKDTIDEPIDTTTGIYQIITKEEILVTPKQGLVEFSIKSPYQNNTAHATLLNVNGQVVFEKSIAANTTQTINDLPSGIYILKCRTRENELVKKVVITQAR